MQIQIQEVTVETVRKGNNKPYSKANVVYTANGKNSTKPIMSFANPAVFDAVKDAAPGSMWDVEVKKDGDYWNWVGITSAGAEPERASVTTNTSTAPRSGKVLGSTYETPDERKVKQMYIIKQSSISNALEYLKQTQPAGDYHTHDVVEVAQHFVDYVYGNNVDILKQDNDLDDVPY